MRHEERLYAGTRYKNPIASMVRIYLSLLTPLLFFLANRFRVLMLE